MKSEIYEKQKIFYKSLKKVEINKKKELRKIVEEKNMKDI